MENEIIKRLWAKFKSPLGYSSIDNKNNSMYDLEQFILSELKALKEECVEYSDAIKKSDDCFKVGYGVKVSEIEEAFAKRGV